MYWLINGFASGHLFPIRSVQFYIYLISHVCMYLYGVCVYLFRDRCAYLLTVCDNLFSVVWFCLLMFPIYM